MAFQGPKRLSFYEISSVTDKSTQPLLKSAPPSDESQPHKHSNEKKDVHATIFSTSRHIIQIDLFARVLSSNYQNEI